jgi:ABC-type lipoprotein export system ATPase subunit
MDPSGSGKTTLLSMMSAVLKPSDGPIPRQVRLARLP